MDKELVLAEATYNAAGERVSLVVLSVIPAGFVDGRGKVHEVDAQWVLDALAFYSGGRI